jgi:phosphatidylglycerol:prolipoprotein diacylglycerol transferase
MRVNCFLSGCCGGWEVCLGSFCFAWPTQAIESIGDFAILLWLLKQEDTTAWSGTLYPKFMVAYSAMRFFLEFLRDTSKDWLFLSHGQVFSLLAIVVGGVWLWFLRQNKKTS